MGRGLGKREAGPAGGRMGGEEEDDDDDDDDDDDGGGRDGGKSEGNMLIFLTPVADCHGRTAGALLGPKVL